jgi:hypothetical protein
MGKKSKRNKNNNGGTLQNGLAAAVPTAPPKLNIYKTVRWLMEATNWEKILQVESKYHHLESFSDDPAEDAFNHWAFGCANHANYKGSKDDACCLERTIHYFERTKEQIEEVNADGPSPKSVMSEIEMHLALLYSDGRDMEKTISSHRLFLEICSHHEVTAKYLIQLSSNFNQFVKFEYAIEVLEGSMDMMKTLEDEAQAKNNLITAYTAHGEFLKAKATHETRRSTDKMDGVHRLQLGFVEEVIIQLQSLISKKRQLGSKNKKA